MPTRNRNWPGLHWSRNQAEQAAMSQLFKSLNQAAQTEVGEEQVVQTSFVINST